MQTEISDTANTMTTLSFPGFDLKRALAMRHDTTKSGVAMLLLARHSSSLLKFFHKNPKLLTKFALKLDKRISVPYGQSEAKSIKLLCLIKFGMKAKVAEIQFPKDHKPNWFENDKHFQAVPKALMLIKAATSFDDDELTVAEKRKVVIALHKVFKVDEDEEEYFLSEVGSIIKDFTAADASKYAALGKRAKKLLKPSPKYLGGLLRDSIMAYLYDKKVMKQL